MAKIFINRKTENETKSNIFSFFKYSSTKQTMNLLKKSTISDAIK